MAKRWRVLLAALTGCGMLGWGLVARAETSAGTTDAVKVCTYAAAKAVTGTTVKAGSCPSYPFDSTSPCPWGPGAYAEGSNFGVQHEVLVCIG